jgi:hypothetical protein
MSLKAECFLCGESVLKTRLQAVRCAKTHIKRKLCPGCLHEIALRIQEEDEAEERRLDAEEEAEYGSMGETPPASGMTGGVEERGHAADERRPCSGCGGD